MCPKILGYQDQRAMSRTSFISKETVILTNRGRVRYLHDQFGHRKVRALTEGRKLVVCWMYGRASLVPNENICHACLPLVDFRADKPPYDIFTFELTVASEASSARVVAPRLISNVALVSKQQRFPMMWDSEWFVCL